MTTNPVPIFVVERNVRGELQARTDIELQQLSDTTSRVARVTTDKSARGGVSCDIMVGVLERGRAGGFSGFTYALGIGGVGDYYATLASEKTRATEKAISRVHTAGLAAIKDHLTTIRVRYGIAAE